METPVDIAGFETVRRGPHTVLIHPEWRPFLLDDLLDDFHRLGPSERRAHSGGRVPHFSYLPGGAPGPLFVRHAVRGGAIGSLLGGLYVSFDRALRELRATAVARRAGVAVPEPIALRATRVAGLFWRFILVAREIEGASNLLDLAATLTPAAKRAALTGLADELSRLHAAGVYHADLTVKNILMGASGLHLIDLDKAALPGSRSDARDVSNLARLNRSVEKCLGPRRCVTRADKLRFLRRYLGGRGRIREISGLCASGLWMHRLWWALTGRA